MATPAYLDNNATAPVRPEARAAALAAIDAVGNPSSTHAFGRGARARLEAAREQLASAIDATRSEIVFTSGATEANATALDSAIRAGARRIIIGAGEHPSLSDAAEASGIAVETLPLDPSGRVDLAWLAEALERGPDGPGLFVGVSMANAETGVIQPIPALAGMVRAVGGWLHVDACQAVGKTEVAFDASGASSLSLSGHKFGAPQGVGALVFRSETRITPRTLGGGQERGFRGGTENIPGISALGAAAQAARRDLPEMAAQAQWRDAVERAVGGTGAVVLGAQAERAPSVLCFAEPGLNAPIAVMALDLEGVMVSAGSACASGKTTPSRAAAAIGKPELGGSVIRVSGGWRTTEDDWLRFLDVWPRIRERAAAKREWV